MTDQKKTNFDAKAATWDENPRRVNLAHDVADVLIREIKPTQDMDALDYGCGTGLVTLKLQPLVKSITGVDSSEGMLDVIKEKVRRQGLQNINTQLVDFEQGGKVDGKFHLVVSCMTLHHMREPEVLFRPLYDLLLPGGSLGITDLDKEEGLFHDDNTGVFHFGFDRAYVKNLLEKIGFRDVRDLTAATMVKTIGGQRERKFSVFLIIGKK
ncbi:MAG TPA: class I SAM-dependent methyltransferase [Thermodesulfobacteriota bacterium]|nr:class I SAM-dependent methyltransferase [Thermodesulfobacteriota bacterium]